MKLEIPIALLLLAVGCWLWGHAPATPDSASESAPESVPGRVAPDNSNSKDLPSNRPANGARPPISAPPRALNEQGVQQASFPLNGGRDAKKPPEGGAGERDREPRNSPASEVTLLRRAAQTMVESGSVEAVAEIQVQWFNRSFSFRGKYDQFGGGYPHARFEVQAGGDPAPDGVPDVEPGGVAPPSARLIQVCDGRFAYRIQQRDDRSLIQFFDLQRIARADAGRLLSDPGHWMMVGGLPGMLNQLAEQFEFDEATRETFEGIPVYTLRGRWKPDRLRRWVALPEADSIDWRSVPDPIPHSVEIRLGADEFLPLFPYQIRFQKLVRKSGDWQAHDFIVWTMTEVTKRRRMDPDRFVVTDTDAELQDLTDQYLDRLRSIENQFEAIVPASRTALQSR